MGENTGRGNFAVPNHNILQALKKAQKALQEERYGEALEGLTQVLCNGEDYFYQPDRKVPIYKSLKAEARQLLGEMPREARDLLEVRSGAEARVKLERAAAAGDAAGLAEISAQWFHTRAGYEATYLLALNQMDHGMPLAGALTLERLHDAGPVAETFEPGLSLTQAACYYQAGMTEDCRQVLIDLKRRWGKPSLQLAGREVAWFEQQSDAPAWLAKLAGLQANAAARESGHWAMFRGDAAQTPRPPAASVVGPPLAGSGDRRSAPGKSPARTAGPSPRAGPCPLLRTPSAGRRRRGRDATAANVLAVDFQTGKRLWQTSPDENVDPRPSRSNGMLMSAHNPMGLPARYGQRIWDDAAYGTLSSDGGLVFVVEGLSLGVTGPFAGFVRIAPFRQDEADPAISNRLSAYDIHSGILRWDMGGEKASRQGDTFFLGPPLPLCGQLYVLAEIKDEIPALGLEWGHGQSPLVAAAGHGRGEYPGRSGPPPGRRFAFLRSWRLDLPNRRRLRGRR